MKKMNVIITVLVLTVILLASCGTSGGGGSSTSTSTPSSTPAPTPAPVERKVAGSYPDFVKDAVLNAPEDVLVGIGSAKLAATQDALARTTATTRARAEISRQMNTMIQDMIRDYSAASEADPTAAISFQENITTALSKSQLTGSKVVAFDKIDGTTWVVVHLGKSSLVEEINQSQAAAKLAVPAMASFNAEERMNAAFANINNQPVQARDY